MRQKRAAHCVANVYLAYVYLFLVERKTVFINSSRWGFLISVFLLESLASTPPLIMPYAHSTHACRVCMHAHAGWRDFEIVVVITASPPPWRSANIRIFRQPSMVSEMHSLARMRVCIMSGRAAGRIIAASTYTNWEY